MRINYPDRIFLTFFLVHRVFSIRYRYLFRFNLRLEYRRFGRCGFYLYFTFRKLVPAYRAYPDCRVNDGITLRAFLGRGNAVAVEGRARRVNGVNGAVAYGQAGIVCDEAVVFPGATRMPRPTICT